MNQYEIETRDFEERVTAVVVGEIGRDDPRREVYVTDPRREPDLSARRTLVVQPFS